MCYETTIKYALCSHLTTIQTQCGQSCQGWPGEYQRVEGVSCEAPWCRFNSARRSGSARPASSVNATILSHESTECVRRGDDGPESRGGNEGTAPKEQRSVLRVEPGAGCGEEEGGNIGLARLTQMGEPERGGGGPRRPGMPGGDDSSSSSSEDEQRGDVGSSGLGESAT